KWSSSAIGSSWERSGGCGGLLSSQARTAQPRANTISCCSARMRLVPDLAVELEARDRLEFLDRLFPVDECHAPVRMLEVHEHRARGARHAHRNGRIFQL